MKNLLAAFADDAKMARKEMNVTQEQISEWLDISNRWYQEVESGKGNLTFALACKISAILSLNLDKYSNRDIDISSHKLKDK